MKLLVDMNLSPDWVPLLETYGLNAQHWSKIGAGNAPDTLLMQWAREHDHVILTQDLDFSQLLFATRDNGPSVVLLRMENEFEGGARAHVCRAILAAQNALVKGALLTISDHRVRLRHLPIFP
jgi:predicted nuclease of predicted toxin-antitoxin system